MTVADDLRAARALVEKGWTQGAYARTKTGKECPDRSLHAKCWCASGAIWRVCAHDGIGFSEAHKQLSAAINKPIPYWNDAPGRTQAEVLAAFDRAIEIAEGRQ
jgi:hypothetical protein